MPRNDYPSTKLTRTELQTYAADGIRNRVRTIERELHRLQKEFPALFITDTPFVLLAPEPRTDGSAWPLVAPETDAPRRRSTPRTGSALHKQRTTSARILAYFTREEPRPIPKGIKGSAASGLLRHGYLKKVGRNDDKRGLFIRTAKDFVV